MSQILLSLAVTILAVAAIIQGVVIRHLIGRTRDLGVNQVALASLIATAERRRS